MGLVYFSECKTQNKLNIKMIEQKLVVEVRDTLKARGVYKKRL